MKLALCVGINYYEDGGCLKGCVKDAMDMVNTLQRNGDGTANFEAISLIARDEDTAISKPKLRIQLRKLFESDVETALFYFSGHGAVDDYGGYLCTSDVMSGDDGFAMSDLMDLVAKSPARNKIIILDCCFSGALANCQKLGKDNRMVNFCELPENTTIISACTDNSVAYEGLFTPLVIDALRGGAMDMIGEVSLSGVYSYVDRALGAWYQRPVFKANIKNSICLRKNNPPIAFDILRRITDHFVDPFDDYPLDPTFEEDKNISGIPDVNKEHEAIFADMREYARVNLVVPVGEEYMYWAAVRSKACRLTPLGRYYWRLVATNRI